eukprot:6178868-Pleurochrysis_carterae.AAC.2
MKSVCFAMERNKRDVDPVVCWGRDCRRRRERGDRKGQRETAWFSIARKLREDDARGRRGAVCACACESARPCARPCAGSV